MSDVTTRADDRWARLTLLLWSQREEDWRERVKPGQDGRYDRTFNVLAPHLSTTEVGESICQVGKLHEMYKEEMARRMEEQKNRAFRSAPRRPRPCARVPTLEQMNDQLRNDHRTRPSQVLVRTGNTVEKNPHIRNTQDGTAIKLGREQWCVHGGHVGLPR